MKTKMSKRVMAVVMAVLLTVGIMPTNWAVKKVAAEDTTHVFDATAQKAIGSDQTEVPDGTTYADGYFKTTGKVTQRTNNDGSIKCYEVAKDAAGTIQFTTTGNATVTVKASSTGGSNTSVLSLVKGGTAVADNTGADIVSVTSTTAKEFTWEVSAGTYDVLTPAGTDNSRNARIFTITVVEGEASGSTDGTGSDSADDDGYKSEQIDVTGGLTAGTVYGTEGIAEIKVLEDMKFSTDHAGQIDGVDYTGAVQGSNNAKPNKGDVPTSGAAFEITALKDGKITVVTKAAAKTYHFVDKDKTSDMTAGEIPAGSLTFSIEKGKTYYFYADGSKPTVYTILLESGTAPLDWSTVAAPELGTPVVDGAKITVPYTAVVGDDGGEQIKVEMYKGDTLVDTQTSKAAGTEGTVEFTPSASGDYTFKASLTRAGQDDKTSSTVSASFVLPLAAPTIDTITSKGSGSVEVVFAEVAEAESYEVLYSTDGSNYTTGASTKDTTVVFTVPSTGVEYSFKVVAKRGSDSKESDVVKATVVNEVQRTWSFSAFGQGVSSSSKDCGFEGSANSGSVTVWDLNGKGKIVPASTDGLSFYYTAVPTSQNFTLTAKVTVDSWTLSNGQEGFGLMAADRVGKSGDSSVFWNNSYMASVTKVEYYADETTNEVTLDTITQGVTASAASGSVKVTKKLGIGSQEKTGVTKANLSKLEANDTTTVNNEFKSSMTTLEYSGVTGNIVGNATATVSDSVDSKTEFIMSIQRNNTGYFVSYTDTATGETVTKKYYDTTALDQLDSDNVYVGFYASRNAKITVSDISLTTIDPALDDAAEEQPVTTVVPSYKISSSSVSNSEDYKLKYIANSDGHVVITAKDGTVIADQDVEANKVYSYDVKLSIGENKYNVAATPNEGYKPSEYEVLESYDEVTFSHTVTYNSFTGDVIYVGPEAESSGKGTYEDPIDIYTAVKFAKAGQRIVVLSGTYNLESTLTIQPGIDGTADAPIIMVAASSLTGSSDADKKAASENTTRPVLDFGKNCEGFVIAGDYWYIQGIDVTNSANAKDGMRLSGSHCTIDNINTYHNGNTGLQISRYATTDQREDWPSYNLILNCTSYGNADEGYEDADGFAAKLTVGNGNVFDGCVAYNNADDGWDLFAKVETGSIGVVTIRNCVAYANGYLEDGTNAGNGNGFKMGGSSLSGYHVLQNSVAFDNKAKGIDSNSCPDNQIYYSTSFNNGGSNVALYTNDSANTDFYAEGILSYRTQYTDVSETFKLKGTQDTSKVYQSSNYFWNASATATYNSDLEAAVEVNASTGANNSNGTVTSADFVSVDTHMNYDTHVYSEAPITRNADGTLNMKNTLVVSDAGQKLGAGAGSNAAVTYMASVGASTSSVSAQISLEGLTTTGGLVYHKTVDTGDSANMMMYVIMLLAAASALAVVFAKKKKNA